MYLQYILIWQHNGACRWKYLLIFKIFSGILPFMVQLPFKHCDVFLSFSLYSSVTVARSPCTKPGCVGSRSYPRIVCHMWLQVSNSSKKFPPRVLLEEQVIGIFVDNQHTERDIICCYLGYFYLVTQIHRCTALWCRTDIQSLK